MVGLVDEVVGLSHCEDEEREGGGWPTRSWWQTGRGRGHGRIWRPASFFLASQFTAGRGNQFFHHNWVAPLGDVHVARNGGGRGLAAHRRHRRRRRPPRGTSSRRRGDGPRDCGGQRPRRCHCYQPRGARTEGGYTRGEICPLSVGMRDPPPSPVRLQPKVPQRPPPRRVRRSQRVASVQSVRQRPVALCGHRKVEEDAVDVARVFSPAVENA